MVFFGFAVVIGVAEVSATPITMEVLKDPTKLSS